MYNKSLQELSSHFAAADNPTAQCFLYTTLPNYKLLTVWIGSYQNKEGFMSWEIWFS